MINLILEKMNNIDRLSPIVIYIILLIFIIMEINYMEINYFSSKSLNFDYEKDVKTNLINKAKPSSVLLS